MIGVFVADEYVHLPELLEEIHGNALILRQLAMLAGPVIKDQQNVVHGDGESAVMVIGDCQLAIHDAKHLQGPLLLRKRVSISRRSPHRSFSASSSRATSRRR